VTDSRKLHVSYPEDFGAEFHRREMRRTATLVPSQTPLIDIGCGSGLISQLISSKVGYVGIDFNPNYLATTWKGRTVDGKIGGNILSLPFLDSSFRTALLLHVIEHFPAEKQILLLREAYRVLSKRGRLIISTPNLDTLRNAEKFLPPNNPKHFHCLHLQELRTLLKEAGFQEIRRHGFDVVIEYPNRLLKMIPEGIRRQAAQRISKLEKHLIFTAERP
jgi:SAM-dependent methyltransferase